VRLDATRRSDPRSTTSSCVPAPSRLLGRSRVSASEVSYVSRSSSPMLSKPRRRANVRRARACAERSESSSPARAVPEPGRPRDSWPRKPSLLGLGVFLHGRSLRALQTTFCRRGLLRFVSGTGPNSWPACRAHPDERFHRGAPTGFRLRRSRDRPQNSGLVTYSHHDTDPEACSESWAFSTRCPATDCATNVDEEHREEQRQTVFSKEQLHMPGRQRSRTPVQPRRSRRTTRTRTAQQYFPVPRLEETGSEMTHELRSLGDATAVSP